MPGRRSGVGVAFGVGNGLAVAVGGNHKVVGVEVAVGVCGSLGAAGAKVTRQPERAASKSKADTNVRRLRGYTKSYYSERSSNLPTKAHIVFCRGGSQTLPPKSGRRTL